MPRPATLDHVVIRAADLESGAAYAADELGITMVAGGAHAAMGTHNILSGLGGLSGPYLEVIAIDPSADAPDRARWFALDEMPETADPHLSAWILRVDDPVPSDETGPALALARGDLRWRVTVRDDGRMPYDGVGPALIAWDDAAPSLPPGEARLISVIAVHPDATRLSDFLDDLDLAAPVSVQAGESPRLLAAFDTPLGPRILTSDARGIDVITERQAAMDLFHRTWRYLDREDRVAEHDEAMIASAEASLWHWRRVGAATQWAIGEWQCSRVHSVLGDGERALAHAQRCLAIAEADRVDDFVPASAHEALSRAYAVLGDMEAAREERNLSYRLAVELDDEERDVIEHDLGTIPIPLG
ncbi:MAG: hypothetical protein RLZ94_2459 [Actinomycetota bacterium]